MIRHSVTGRAPESSAWVSETERRRAQRKEAARLGAALCKRSNVGLTAVRCSQRGGGWNVGAGGGARGAAGISLPSVLAETVQAMP